MLHLDHCKRPRYLAVILAWVGYASGLSGAPLQLESTPLFLNIRADPNVLFMIDDSGSMAWEVITGDLSNDGRYTNIQRDGSASGSGQVVHRDNDDNGQPDCSFGSQDQSFYGYAYGVEFPTNGDPSPDGRNCNTADDAEWRFRNHNFNSLYFDPNQTYVPWAGVDAAGQRFQPMSIHAAKDNPYDPNSRTIDLTQPNSTGDPNATSDRNNDGISDGFRYYTWTDMNGNGLFDDGEETVHFIKDEPANQQNFANWFSYYRKRAYVVKAMYGDVIASMSNVRVGLVTLHNGPQGINPQVTSINTPLQAIDVDPNAPNQGNTDVGDTTTPNGLATPAVVDVDGDFTADYLIAGDLRGNLWRIDVTSTAPQDWQQPAQRALLFTATDGNGTPQPITSRPAVGKHPDGLAGFVVYFGTGKYLESTDNMTPGAPTQTFYGIWDKNLLGAHVLRSDLLQQTVLATPTITDASGNQHTTRVTSDNAIDWQIRRGFYLDLPVSGERQVSDAVLRSDRIIFSTLIPNDQPCSSGGTSFLFALDVHGGVRPTTPVFDINQDRLFDNQDKVMVNTLLPPSAIDPGAGIMKTPTLQVSGPTIDDTHVGAVTIGMNRDNEPAGRQAWRRITQ